MQQGAGSNRLDGLAQAHLVGQQRAFSEGQVEHALALVREEGDLGFVRGPFTAVHLQLVVAPKLFALGGMAPAFEPGREFLRQAQGGQRPGGKLLEGRDGIFGLPLAQRTLRIKPGPQDGGQVAFDAEQPDRVASRIGQQVQARSSVRFRSPEQAFEASLKLQQHGFDVFAGAETVDAEINAIAGELPPAHFADLHRVSQAAPGPDAEAGEDRMARVGIRDAEFLGPGTRPAAVDFVFVRRAPIVRGRHGNFR